MLQVGDRIVFTAMEKIALADGTAVNIPPGTTGVVVHIEEGEGTVHTIRCAPETIYFEPSFLVRQDEAGFLGHIAHIGDRGVDVERLRASALRVPIYDDDMPGFMRNDGAYVVEEEGGEYGTYLLFRRRVTKWQVEVRFYPGSNSPEELEGVYRTTHCDGKECEQFTLMPGEMDYACVQVQVFSGGSRVRSYVYVPAEVCVDRRKKLVTIYLLCRIEIEEGRVKVFELPD